MSTQQQETDKLVLDTSVIIEGIVSKKIENKELKPKQVIIHEAIIAELEFQANLNKAIGFLGLEEIKKIHDLTKDFELKFGGTRPRQSDIKYASLGDIGALIRQLAFDEDATLMTSDKIQTKVALSKGMKVLFIEPSEGIKKLKIDKFFDDETMSVHLREGVFPNAKKGFPGNWSFVALRKTLLKQEEIQDISQEIIEDAKLRRDGFIEIERPGSTIVQLGRLRIVITKPPFSDGWEITAVRPVRTLTLEEYKLSDKLTKRIAEQAEGILVAGAPGMGKSTFAQALAIHYATQDKIVKTVEAPRDLILPENITQYAISHGDAQEVHDVLLLSRPDYTIFDEMRNTKDFELFADLRLAGVGMVGVVHATKPIDTIQRFLTRVELGVIPQIVDTVVYIKNGIVSKVLSLKMGVKVPSGMTEADLARPVVEVFDFETNKLEFEIYSYGEQTVVIPVSDVQQKASGTHALASRTIEKYFQRYTNVAQVEVLSNNKCIVRVPEGDIARIIGKQGSNISKIQDDLGISIDIQELDGNVKQKPQGNETDFHVQISKNVIMFDLGQTFQHKDVHIYVNDDFILQAKAGPTGIIKIKRKNNLGSLLVDAHNGNDKIKLYV